MSSVANWSYTAPCTIWRKKVGEDGSTMNEYGDPLGFTVPEVVMCDYGGGLSAKIGDIGTEQVVKNTFWTEFDKAEKGDYILIGQSTDPDPLTAGADEIMQIIRYADTFERLTDDFAILTGV